MEPEKEARETAEKRESNEKGSVGRNLGGKNDGSEIYNRKTEYI